MKYQKKPIAVDAEQWQKNNLNDPESLFQSPRVIIRSDGEEFLVETLEGTMKGKVGDYLIKGVKGEFYPVRRDIFEQTYDPVSAPKPGTVICLEGAEDLGHGKFRV